MLDVMLEGAQNMNEHMTCSDKQINFMRKDW